MAFTFPIPLASLFLFSSILGLLTLHSKADGSNVLLTGDVLGTDSQLYYQGSTFVMQGDCNLVLYNKLSGFQSNTHGAGVNCTLTLNDYGQFIIRSGDGSTVWTSTPTTETKRGNYAAVLRPDRQVAIYGPAVWSTPDFHFTSAAGRDSELLNVPLVANVLFSSQVLYSNSSLTTRDYTFIMEDDCNLALIKADRGAIWQSGTQGNGQHCFLRLNHIGKLAVVDDLYQIVWTSYPASTDGDYVLVLQINGQAVIYGPVVWSTADPRSQGYADE